MWTSKTVLALNQKRLLWRQWTSWRNVFVLWNGQFTPSVPSIFVSKVKSGKQPAARCFLCFFCCCFSLGSLGHRTQSLGQNFFGKPVSGSACVGIPYLCLWSAVIGTEWVQWAIVASLCSVAVDPIQNANRARFGSAPFESRPKNRRTQLRVPREHWPRKCGRRTSPHTRNVRCDATTTTTTTTTTTARWKLPKRPAGADRCTGTSICLIDSFSCKKKKSNNKKTIDRHEFRFWNGVLKTALKVDDGVHFEGQRGE